LKSFMWERTIDDKIKPGLGGKLCHEEYILRTES